MNRSSGPGESSGSLTLSPEQETALDAAAETLIKAVNVGLEDNVLIWFDEPGNPLVDRVIERCEELASNVETFKRDLAKDLREVSKLTPDQVADYFTEERELVNRATKIIIVRGPEDPEIISQLPKPLKDKYDEEYADIHECRTNGKTPWVLTYWPTEYEARIEGMSYPEYFQVVLDSLDQDWDAIHHAQGILKREILDPAEKIRFVANPDGDDPRKKTDITMSIKGMTFCNSTVDANVPGSELFSAPVIDSMNGQIFVKGKSSYGGFVFEDIFLKVENGKIVRAECLGGTPEEAAEATRNLEKILSKGEGARFFGEVAIGTNPGLKELLFNTLLKEKTGGSFHVAIGHCYEFDEYNGEPVHLNNGNTKKKTSVHWDIVIRMHPEDGGGFIEVDDKVIQRNGCFIDPRFEALNPLSLRN